ncbi:hypothetical protein JW977_01300 [Candidatus Falkowbacteria bacterium]|nr:hypothetical protein [Candidatus Falkowbacteria bacterium]
MKRLLAVLFLFFLLMPARAFSSEEDELTYEGQYDITLKHEFLEFGEKKNSLLGAVDLFGTLDGYNALFTYFGPQFNISDDLTLWLLAGTLNETGGGMAITASVWADYYWGNEDVNNIFVEGGYYIPVDVFPYQFYFWTEYNRALKDDVNFGVSMELFGNAEEGELSEFALGPHIGLGNWKIWTAYDWSPSIDGEIVSVRLIYEH